MRFKRQKYIVVSFSAVDTASLHRGDQFGAIFRDQLHPLTLDGEKIFTSRDAGNVMFGQAEFDCEVAANGSCAHNGYAQRHDKKIREVDIREVCKSKSVCKGRWIVILN